MFDKNDLQEAHQEWQQATYRVWKWWLRSQKPSLLPLTSCRRYPHRQSQIFMTLRFLKLDPQTPGYLRPYIIHHLPPVSQWGWRNSRTRKKLWRLWVSRYVDSTCCLPYLDINVLSGSMPPKVHRRKSAESKNLTKMEVWLDVTPTYMNIFAIIGTFVAHLYSSQTTT